MESEQRQRRTVMENPGTNRTMRRPQLVSIGFGLITIFASADSHAAERQSLRGHVPTLVGKLAPTERLPASSVLTLAIGLPLRNTNELTALLKQIYDPASPQYRQFLTAAQF